MANKQIKGITVEIGGNTTKLGNALKDSEKQSRNLSKELREVDAALKFNPDNIELLTQKQKLLTNQVDETANALDVLRQAEDQIAAKFKSGEIGEEQYRAFQRELVTTESKLNNYKSKLDQTETAIRNLGTETKQTAEDTDKFDKELKEAEETLDKAKDAAKDLAEGLGKIGGAGVAGATAAVTASVSVESAMHSLQAQTGKTDAEMVEFEKSLKNLYNDNYGESLESLADQMARVAQYTGETDAGKIEDMTKKVITLEDTFNMDFNETLRGVDALMKNMGLTADEAFDYITKGAQNGLNKSDELGDNLAEYTQLWSQAGFSAEEMFTILDNGLDNGAYNLDKVNDFVKEFTISLSDGRIEENIDSFGTSTKKFFDKWKRGKATSADVFKAVIKDLKNAENQQEALTTASNVWSALGEDNAMAIITSLNDVNDTFVDVKGTMDEVNEIKYDDVGNRFKALGRTVLTEVVAPMGEKLLPTAEKFIKYASENLDDLIPIVKTLGATFATVFVVNKVATFVDSISKLSGVFSSLSTVLMAHPILGLAALIAGVTGAVVALTKAKQAQIEEAWGLTDAEKELNETIKLQKEAYDEAKQARDEANAGIEAEIGHAQNLWAELQTVVDENGKIKKGYEERAAVIASTLAEALGLEIEIVDGQILKYDELKKSVEDVINTKRAEALLDANKGAYTDAIKAQTEAFNVYNEKLEQVKESEERLAQAKAEEQFWLEAEAKGYTTSAEQAEVMTNGLLDARIAIEEATKAHEENKTALAEAQETYLGYGSVIDNYDALVAAASGNTDNLTEAMDNLSNGFMTAENATKSMLENQLTQFQTQYDNMKAAVDAGMPGVSQAQVDQMADLVNRAESELNKLQPKAVESGKKAVKDFGAGINSEKENAKNSAKKVSDEANKYIGSADTKKTGSKVVKNYSAGINSELGTAESAGKNISKKTNSGMGSADTKATGNRLGRSFTGAIDALSGTAESSGKKVSNRANSGMGSANTKATGSKAGKNYGAGITSELGTAERAGKNVSNKANSGLGSADAKSTGTKFGKSFTGAIDALNGTGKTSGKNLANKGKDGLASVSAYSAGQDFGRGFSDGTSSMSTSVWSAARSLASSALSSVKNALGIKSPSREAAALGEFFSEGFAQGVNNASGEAIGEVETMAANALTSLNAVNDFTVNPMFGNQSEIERSLRVSMGTGIEAPTNPTSALSGKLDRVIGLLENLGKLGIYLDGDKLVGETIDRIDAGLADREALSMRGV